MARVLRQSTKADRYHKDVPYLTFLAVPIGVPLASLEKMPEWSLGHTGITPPERKHGCVYLGTSFWERSSSCSSTKPYLMRVVTIDPKSIGEPGKPFAASSIGLITRVLTQSNRDWGIFGNWRWNV